VPCPTSVWTCVMGAQCLFSLLPAHTSPAGRRAPGAARTPGTEQRRRRTTRRSRARARARARRWPRGCCASRSASCAVRPRPGSMRACRRGMERGAPAGMVVCVGGPVLLRPVKVAGAIVKVVFMQLCAPTDMGQAGGQWPLQDSHPRRGAHRSSALRAPVSRVSVLAQRPCLRWRAHSARMTMQTCGHPRSWRLRRRAGPRAAAAGRGAGCRGGAAAAGARHQVVVGGQRARGCAGSWGAGTHGAAGVSSTGVYALCPTFSFWVRNRDELGFPCAQKIPRHPRHLTVCWIVLAQVLLLCKCKERM